MTFENQANQIKLMCLKFIRNNTPIQAKKKISNIIYNGKKLGMNNATTICITYKDEFNMNNVKKNKKSNNNNNIKKYGNKESSYRENIKKNMKECSQ